MPKIEQYFDYVKINLASPQRIKKWGERALPNGQIVGEDRKSTRLNSSHSSVSRMPSSA